MAEVVAVVRMAVAADLTAIDKIIALQKRPALLERGGPFHLFVSPAPRDASAQLSFVSCVK
jgi:hypothetical protein